MGMMKLENWQAPEDLKPMVKLLAEGEGSFTVKKIYTTDKYGNPKLSSKGDPMASIMLEVRDKQGDTGTLYDFFTCRTLFKIKAICDAIGRPELYQPEFDYDQLLGCHGRLNIIIEQYDGKTRNGIKSYIKHKAATPNKYASQEEHDALEGDLSVMDDVPF